MSELLEIGEVPKKQREKGMAGRVRTVYTSNVFQLSPMTNNK